MALPPPWLKAGSALGSLNESTLVPGSTMISLESGVSTDITS